MLLALIMLCSARWRYSLHCAACIVLEKHQIGCVYVIIYIYKCNCKCAYVYMLYVYMYLHVHMSFDINVFT